MFCVWTFVSDQADVDWRQQPSSQRLPPPHHHVDGASSVQDGLHHLLPVLIGQVHVVNLQQPIVHSVNRRGRTTTRFNEASVNDANTAGCRRSSSYLNLPSATLPLSTLVTNIPQSPGRYGSLTPSVMSKPRAFKSMSSWKDTTIVQTSEDAPPI